LVSSTGSPWPTDTVLRLPWGVGWVCRGRRRPPLLVEDAVLSSRFLPLKSEYAPPLGCAKQLTDQRGHRPVYAWFVMYRRLAALGGWGAIPAAFLALTLVLGPASAAPQHTTEEALKRAYAEPELQTTLPRVSFDSIDRAATADLSFLDRFVRWLGKGGLVPLLIRLLAVCAATLLAVLGILWLSRHLAEHGDFHAPAVRASAPLLDVTPLLQAESLAGQSRFREAIHLLLLRTFEMLARRVGSRLAPGMTSREVLVGLGLPEAALPALTELVDAVEATAFAGRPASFDDYTRCAARFSVLQQTLEGKLA
jgi:hypothetical protein